MSVYIKNLGTQQGWRGPRIISGSFPSIRLIPQSFPFPSAASRPPAAVARAGKSGRAPAPAPSRPPPPGCVATRSLT
eukprot:613826-Pleurochrysis_carterae.AAC.1